MSQHPGVARMMVRWLTAFALLATGWPIGAQGPSSGSNQQGGVNGATAAPRQTRVGPKDQLRITVDELPALPQEWTVVDDGSITIDPIGKVMAQGLTETELRDRIRDALIEHGVRRPTVSVVLTAYRSRPILVLGAVATPGNQSAGLSTRLMEVLLTAGGLGSDHGPTLQIRRSADNGLSDQIVISVRELIEDLDPDVNLPIFAGDVINVAAARAVQVHLLGAVKTVGTVTFKNTERVTLLTAIARAGGLSETASRKISLKRTDPATGRLDERMIDFKRILDGKEADVELRDGDILVVKESFF